ncbi:MAG: PEP/pyruvate-binding domain-containing protein [Ardenticatenaceae bacterium]
MVHFFDELGGEQYALAGGKGGMLARLYQGGYPVPKGFVILPEAFKEEELRAVVRQKVERLREEGAISFAVRSSGLSEDGAQAAFAGLFESVLDVQSDEGVWEAIMKVRASRGAERVLAYSETKGIKRDHEHEHEDDREDEDEHQHEHEMAVVVQKLVRAEMAGVLFTADPLTGSRVKMVGNFVHGLGDKLVSGDVSGLNFALTRPKGVYHGPNELARCAGKLYRLANRLEEELDGALDIEWAIADGEVYLLQARPVTTMQAHNPATGEWNDSLLGDYLWTNANFGEALPDVMTPFTWSIMQAYFRNNMIGFESRRLPMGGNIGGRLYMNISLFISATDAIGLSRQKMMRLLAEAFGHVPTEIEIPTTPFSRWRLLRTLIRPLFRRMRLVRGLKKRIPTFIAEAPARAEALQAQIRATNSPAELLALWHDKLQACLDETCLMLAAGTSDYKNLSRKLHIDFEKMVGEADANALLSAISRPHEHHDDHKDHNDHDHHHHLASLGPLIGLTKVARGEMTREQYIKSYGHRGPHELELSQPRPAEAPEWIEQQLAEIERHPTQVSDLLAKQQTQHQAAWQRFAKKYPRKANSYRQKLDRMAQAAKTREMVRSEVVRLFGVFRTFALHVAQMTGVGATLDPLAPSVDPLAPSVEPLAPSVDPLAPSVASQEHIFFLSLDEILEMLAGNESPTAYIAARKETHARYSALPPYPALINGRFDPFQWAADPNRRHDIFDAHATQARDHPSSQAGAPHLITGFAGAAGIVEGTVRLLHTLQEAHHLQPGEILVTTTTNIGWTPLFPRLAAIVTDVGAPLSHAAIVARELGIPAVVGCANATMRLKTGDRVRVNGGQGTVEVL